MIKSVEEARKDFGLDKYMCTDMAAFSAHCWFMFDDGSSVQWERSESVNLRISFDPENNVDQIDVYHRPQR